MSQVVLLTSSVNDVNLRDGNTISTIWKGWAMKLSDRRLGEYEYGGIQSAEQRRNEVALDLIAISFSRGEYIVGSGVRSEYHLDPALFMTKPTLLRRLGSLLADRLPPDIDRISASEPGSAALAVAVALHTGLPYLTFRDYTSQGFTLYGELHPGERVVHIEDVLSTGKHALRGAHALLHGGAEVVEILGVVDRAEGASRLLSSEGFVYTSLFSATELHEHALFRGHRKWTADGGSTEHG